MMPAVSDRQINQKLKHFKVALTKEFINDSYVEQIIQRLGNVNYQVQPTACLKLHHPELIGLTPLDFALRKRDSRDCQLVFSKLLAHGADYTLKNQEGLTILHSILKSVRNEVNESENACIDAVLSAHITFHQTTNPKDPHGLSHFHAACMTNNLAAVVFFLDNGVSVHDQVSANLANFPGYTSLHFAVKYLSVQVVEVLLKHGASISVKNAKGWSPFHILLKKNFEMVHKKQPSFQKERDSSEKILRLLLLQAIDKDTMFIDDSGLSYFHVASSIMDVAAVEELLKKVTSIDHCVNVTGYTALHFAAIFNVDIVKLLVKRGADLMIKNARGVTPLDLCLERCKIGDIHDIISLKPSWKNIKFSDGKTKLLDLINAIRSSRFLRRISKNVLISLPNDAPLWPGFTPMHLIILFSKSTGNLYDKDRKIVDQTYLDMMSELFDKDPKIIYAVDSHGRQPIDLCSQLGKMKNVFKLLFEFHQKLEKSTTCVKPPKQKPMEISKPNEESNVVDSSSIQLVSDVIVKNSGTLSLCNALNTCKLRFSILLKRNSCLQMLLRKNIGAMAKLHFACIMNDIEAIKALLNDRVDVNATISLESKFWAGFTPLHLIMLHVQEYCENDITAILKLLLDNGADVNAKINSDLKFMSECTPLLIFMQSVKYILPNWNCIKNVMTILLDNGADANAKIGLNSTTWQGWTPLHILTNRPHYCDCQNCKVYQYCLWSSLKCSQEILQLLLNKKADVSLQNAKQRTPLHMAYYYHISHIYSVEDLRQLIFQYLSQLLKAHKDFSCNPVSIEGISHFHIACNVADVDTVEKFLQGGHVDIDQPLEFFMENERVFKYICQAEGYTPLHLTTGRFPYNSEKFIEFKSRIETVDLLLKYGADANAKDASGMTAFHFANLEIRERLARGGADVNAKDAKLYSTLEYLVKTNYGSSSSKSADIQKLLRCGCFYNTYSSENEAGCIGLTARVFSILEMQQLLAILIANFPNAIKSDESGRTIMHNIFSTHQYINVSVDRYIAFIDQLKRAGYDIDDQDNLGRTALHMAVKFQNRTAISALLLAGADMNITDVNGKTAFAFVNYDPCTRCDKPTTAKDELCQHYKVYEIFAQHVIKLQHCEIDVCQQNHDMLITAFPGFSYLIDYSDQFFDELNETEDEKIESYSFTLYDFLSELGVVADFPTMSQVKRNAINDYFHPSQCSKIHEKYGELAGMLKLQYRKALKRADLFEKAMISLNVLAGTRLPDVCSHMILRFLKTSELEAMITASEHNCKMIVD